MDIIFWQFCLGIVRARVRAEVREENCLLKDEDLKYGL